MKLVSLAVVLYGLWLRVIIFVPPLKQDYLFTSQADQIEKKKHKL